MFHHYDHLVSCKRVCDQIIQCALGRTASASDVYEIYKAVSFKQLHCRQTEILFGSEANEVEDSIPRKKNGSVLVEFVFQ